VGRNEPLSSAPNGLIAADHRHVAWFVMPDSTNAAARIGCSISATLILLLPATWNRFPLPEYDSGGYLARRRLALTHHQNMIADGGAA
jgi:hypothetical protein